MPRQRSRWAAVFTLCVLTAAGSRCDDARPTLLACAAPNFDFGDLPASHQGVSHRFEVKNAGAETVDLLAVRTSCDCLTTELARKNMRPGEILALPVHFAFQGRSGVQKRAVHLVYRTHDAPLDHTGTLTLTVQGTVLTPVMRLPDSLDLGVQIPGGAATGTVELVAGQSRAFSIHEVGLDRVDARADYAANAAGLRHLIRLVLPVPQHTGAFSGLALATTDMPDMPQVPIPYHGLAAPLIEAQPSVIAVRRGAGLDTTLALVSAHNVAFRVTDTRATDARVRVTLEFQGAVPCVRVTSHATGETLHGAIVRITTDHPIYRVIEVPIRSSTVSARL